MWVCGDLLAADIGLTASPITCFIGSLSYVVQLLREDSLVETNPPTQSGSTARILWL